MSDDPFAGSWTCRSSLSDPDVSTDFDKPEFGRGTTLHSGGPAGTVAPAGVVCSFHAVRAG